MKRSWGEELELNVEDFSIDDDDAAEDRLDDEGQLSGYEDGAVRASLEDFEKEADLFDDE